MHFYLFFLACTTVFFEAESLQPTPCFDVKRPTVYHCRPSQKGVLRQSKPAQILFRVEDHRKGHILRSRSIQKFFSDQDSLTAIDQQKIDHFVQRYRIAFLGNYTDTVLTLPTIVGGVALIQEAMDEKGVWRPIEYVNTIIDCGTGVFHQIYLHPKEFVEIYVRRYCGPLLTKLRIKLRASDQVLVSETFEGFLHPMQFDLTPLIVKNQPTHYGFIDRDLQEEITRRTHQPSPHDPIGN